jgi:N-acyl-D-amino-acid deacylase
MSRVTDQSLVLRDVRVPTGDDGLLVSRDLVVEAGRIDAVGPPGSGRGGRVLDGGGRLALPGFIDAHSHAGGAVFDPEVQLALLRQGVTGIVVGQDGVGAAPSDDVSARWSARYFEAIDGVHPRFPGGSVRDLLATYDGATPINVATVVPHGTLRYLVMGSQQRAASPAETARMAQVLDQAFDDGAVGLSTGLEYVPAAWAGEAELVALARVTAAHGLPHVSHMRGYESAASSALAELVRIAEATGVATHVSHLHGPLDLILPDLAAAHARGFDVTFDSYLYLRGFSLLSMVGLPTWLPLADADACLAALGDPAVLARLHAEHLDALADLWPRVTLAGLPTDGTGPRDLTWAAGLRLPELAARLGLSPAEAAVTILVETGLRASCIFEQPPTNSPASVRTLLDHPSHLTGSDAIYVPRTGAHLHPRGWGAFARLLAGRVLDRATDLGDGAGTGGGGWSWGDAAEHLSARAARRFRLAGRGTLTPGSVADVVLVDPDTLQDRATFADPGALATGIDDVVVAGVPVLAAGTLTGQTPGRALRPAPRTHPAPAA